MGDKLVPAFLFLLLILRFSFLDQDAPAYMIGGICQEDEGSYTRTAIEKYKKDLGDITPGFPSHSAAPALTLAIFPATYLSLKFFGNNYYGLRLPCVLISILSILLFYYLLQSFQHISKQFALIGTIIFASDFYFSIVSRFQGPQVYSIFFMLLTLAGFVRFQPKSLLAFFILGTGALFSATGVYIYNFFFLVACGLFAGLSVLKAKNFKPLTGFSAGILAGMGIFWILISLSGNTIQEFLTAISGSAQGKIMDSESTGLETFNLVTSGLSFIYTNFFRFNLSVLLLFIFVFPWALMKTIRNPEGIHTLLILIVFSSLLQNSLFNSYPFKKLITVLPMVLLIIFSNFSPALVGLKKSKPLKGLGLFLLAVGLLFSYQNFKVNQAPAYWAHFDYGYYANTGLFVNMVNIAVLGLVTFFLLFSLGGNIAAKNPKWFWMLAVPGLIFSWQYFYHEKTFFARDALRQFAPAADKKKLAGDIFSFALYNRAIPMTDHYTNRDNYRNNMVQLFEEKKADIRILKYFRHEQRYKGLKKGDVFETGRNYQLVVEGKFALKFYDYMLLNREDKK